MDSKPFTCDYAKRGQASCKKCKQKLEKGSLRLGKLVTNPFSEDGGQMKQWFHAKCLFETFFKARATTKIIEDTDDIDDFNTLTHDDQQMIEKLVSDTQAARSSSKKKTTVQKKIDYKPTAAATVSTALPDIDTTGGTNTVIESASAKDNSFRTFRKVCAELADESSYNGKSQIVREFVARGTQGGGFRGDLYMFIKLLLPGIEKRVYNLKDKQIIKVFSQVFHANLDEMTEHLEQGDAADTVRVFFEKAVGVTGSSKSTLSIQDVDNFLERLSGLTKESDHLQELTNITKKCTQNDLMLIVRLIKHDLRINAGAKHILDGLDPNAYEAFQASRNLRDVIQRVMQRHGGSSATTADGDEAGPSNAGAAASSSTDSTTPRKPTLGKALSIRASLMTPVLPMLAEACRSVEQAIRKCPGGFFAEIKYDGERVQVHKQGTSFRYFSRSLKPVLPHKVQHFKDFIPRAFVSGNDLILDAEVLLIDNATSTPLPFGTLSKHKKQAFKGATVCLFVFDCLHLNGENLMKKPMKERRKILEENMNEVKNHVMFSEAKLMTKADELKSLMARVFREGLEGLVLKGVTTVYEPGKRHWLKIKKDYLHEGAMADSADLVVLGAFYGTGNKGGMMSVFLMGAWDAARNRWTTVTKCGNGHDDATLGRLQKELDVVKIHKDYTKLPSWIHCHRNLVPDFVVADPKAAPVWEICGAEFSSSEVHTAGGISIRFPRVTKIRDDKSWREATDVTRLKELYRKSKERSDLVADDADDGVTAVDDADSGAASAGGVSGGDSPAAKRRRTTAAADDSADDDSAGDEEEAMDAQTSSPPKRRAVDVDIHTRPLCRYGAGCYQRDAAHRARFAHPPASPPAKSAAAKSPATVPKSVKSPQSPLVAVAAGLPPPLFAGMSFAPTPAAGWAGVGLPAPADVRRLTRFVVAHDGEVLPPEMRADATHLLVAADATTADATSAANSAAASSIPRLPISWIWDCVRAQKLLPRP